MVLRPSQNSEEPTPLARVDVAAGAKALFVLEETRSVRFGADGLQWRPCWQLTYSLSPLRRHAHLSILPFRVLQHLGRRPTPAFSFLVPFHPSHLLLLHGLPPVPSPLALPGCSLGNLPERRVPSIALGSLYGPLPDVVLKNVRKEVDHRPISSSSATVSSLSVDTTTESEIRDQLSKDPRHHPIHPYDELFLIGLQISYIVHQNAVVYIYNEHCRLYGDRTWVRRR
jgi:hypothetical protein